MKKRMISCGACILGLLMAVGAVGTHISIRQSGADHKITANEINTKESGNEEAAIEKSDLDISESEIEVSEAYATAHFDIPEALVTACRENVILSDDTQIESTEWVDAEHTCFRVRVQYKEEPEEGYRHKEDYFFFLRKDEKGAPESGESEQTAADREVTVEQVLRVDYTDSLADARDLGDRMVWAACDFAAHLEDVTFDGRKDLIIFLGDNGVHGMKCYCAYVFRNGRYEYEPSFEKVCTYHVNERSQVITSDWFISATEQGSRTFVYQDGTFVWKEERDLVYVSSEGVGEWYAHRRWGYDGQDEPLYQEVVSAGSVAEAYAAVLREYLQEAKRDDSWKDPHFALIYLDGDVVPELIVIPGYGHLHGAYVYSYREGQAVQITVPENGYDRFGMYGGFRYLEKTGYFLCDYESVGAGRYEEALCHWNGEEAVAEKFFRILSDFESEPDAESGEERFFVDGREVEKDRFDAGRTECGIDQMVMLQYDECVSIPEEGIEDELELLWLRLVTGGSWES